MIRAFRVVAFVGFLIAVGGCGPTPVPPRTVLDRTGAETFPRVPFSRIGILPVDALFKRVTFDGDDPRRPDVEASVRARAEATLASELRGRGFTVVDAASIEGRYASYPDLRFATTQVKASLANLVESLQARAASAKQNEATQQPTIGPQVASLAGPIGVDAVLVVSVTGYTKSAGELAAEAFKGALRGATIILAGHGTYTPDRLTLAVGTLIDGATGNILWNRAGWTQGDFESEVLEALVRGLVARFPLPPAATPATVAPATLASPVSLQAPSSSPSPIIKPPVASVSVPATPSTVPSSAAPALVRDAAPTALQEGPRGGTSPSLAAAVQFSWSEPIDCRRNVSLATSSHSSLATDDGFVSGRISVVGANPIKNISVCASDTCDAVEGGRVMSQGEVTTFALKSANPKRDAVTIRCSVLREN